MGKVRVRIAPSPTGFAHIGTAYTALFNYAFAKKNDGKFVLRLDDTDTAREVKGSEAQIIEMLGWLGLSWDEGFDKGGEHEPYIQSKRLDRYNEVVGDLIKSNKAYEDDGAVRFKNPGKGVGWKDLVRGNVKFPHDQITDFVIRKSNGFPTYNFASVVDDVDMDISHVIRGEEHTSNTPRQILLFEALGAKVPQFAHLPTLRNKEKKKLSKRQDSVDLGKYRDEGYLPEALVNFLCLLGWSHPKEKEIFSLEKFVDNFDIKRVRKAGPFFDTTKLDWINGEYVRAMTLAELGDQFSIFSDQFMKLPKKEKDQISKLLQTRIKKFSEFNDLGGFFFKKPKVDRKLFGKNYKEHLRKAIEVIEGVENWSQKRLDEGLMEAVNKNDYKTGDFFMDLRIAITGAKYTPPINDSIHILGKKESLARIESALD